MNTLRQKIYEIVRQVYLNGEHELCDDKRRRIEHIHRVEQLALTLANETCEVVDKEILSMGAIMHDIAKYIDQPKHNILGSIITKFLLGDMIDEKTLEDVSGLVLNHNAKDITDNNFSIEQKLLIDADIIDKLNLMRFVNAIIDSDDRKTTLEEFDKIIEKANCRKDCLCTDIGKKYFKKYYDDVQYFINNYKNQFK